MTISSKILHWLIFLAFLILICTAVAANVLFSKEAIMQSFSFSLPAIDIMIPPADQLFVARVERRATWAIHFWTGALFFGFGLFRFLLFLRGKRVHQFLNSLTFTLILLLFASGLPLYIRIYVDIPADVQQFARSMHYALAWIMGLFVVLHIGWVILQENGKKPGIVSQMFRFNGSFWMLLMVTGSAFMTPLHAQPWENDPEYPRMVVHFKKSVDKGNPLAAAKLAQFLIGRIDYRSKVPDPVLIRIGERDTGMHYADYVALAKKALELAAEHHDCYSMYKLAEFLRKGQMGYAPDVKRAKRYYTEIVNRCDPKSFFVMMSRGRIEKLTKDP